MIAAVFGSGARTEALAARLGARGAECRRARKGTIEVRSALEGANAVILPMPVTYDGLVLNGGELLPRVGTLFEEIARTAPGAAVFGGRIAPELAGAAEAHDLSLTDYAADERYLLRGAAVTAEGAVSIAMERLDVTLRGAFAVVTGFGRVGSALAALLRALGARVTVAARSAVQRTAAELSGCASVRLGGADPDAGFRKACGAADVIFNTVPARIFDRAALEALRPGTLLIDLSSVPGGIDLRTAEEAGIRAEWALALPGKYAPGSAGILTADTVLDLWEEKSR